VVASNNHNNFPDCNWPDSYKIELESENSI
jgi:hypothetical protein